MKFQYAVLVIGYCFYLILSGSKTDSFPFQSDEGELVLLHVLFRHGNRTPNGPDELYPKDPYLNETYYPFGLGQLTNAGRRREYFIGATLRQRYHDFLGDYFLPEKVDARSTNYNRTKASLELVLASLYPPEGKQIWNPPIPWQPIPYNYWARSSDKVLMGVECPNYLRIYKETVNSPKLQAEFDKYRGIFDYVSRNTGKNVTTFNDLYNLYFGLSTEEEWGFKLPKWTAKVWPKTITDLAIKEYFVATANTQLNQMASGYLIQKIIRDTQLQIEGKTRGRKIYLYSAHENNVAELLIALGLFDKPHIPNYGAFIVFEVRKIRNSYGFKIFYQNYNSTKPRLLKLPACGSFCELDKFISLTEEYIPSDNLCYQQ